MPEGITQLHTESVSNVTATNSVELGTRRTTGNKEYVYVFNAGGEQASPGQGVIVSALSGYSVTVSSLTETTPVFGVVNEATLTTDTYGWVVVRGHCQLKAPTNTGLAVGDNLSPGDDGVHARITAITGYTNFPSIHGYVTNATASAGTGEGWVNCLL